jgi:hypothetical protein
VIGINYWLKSHLLAVTDAGEYSTFWLGAVAEGRHDEHNPGTWVWQHKNESVSWSVPFHLHSFPFPSIFSPRRFDWADGQPDNYHWEQCLTLWNDGSNPNVRLHTILSYLSPQLHILFIIRTKGRKEFC